ncbi:MAG: hypothetical protein FWF15_08155, partial [Oscillospiraceae bacterium]|nr:hypothetical protein [Oscillospiraceae bacterium]
MQIQIRENLYIRLQTIEDAPQFFAVIDENRAVLREWLLWIDSIATVDQVETTIHEAIENAERGISYRFNIFANEQILGVVEVKNINRFSDS